jgi:hypothetical protein
MKLNPVCFIILNLFIQVAYAGRPYGGYYTKERITSLRANCDKYDWGQKLRSKAIENAKIWLAKSDEQLWAMVPGQDLPRTHDVTIDRLSKGPLSLGCVICGGAIGNYPYHPDIENKPWKITCPDCKSVFPTNDFGKYYASAIDEHGLFNPAKGDRSLLFNVNHPDPADPLHKFGVDDGFGYIDKNGRAHKYVGLYVWEYWRYIYNSGLAALADAYLYTGEKIYAHKAAILLDRIADVYPDMDWKVYADRGWYHSDGNSGLGKIEGRIWENGVVQTMADSYDKILSGTVDDPKLYAFLNQQSKKYQLPSAKGTRDLFLKNVDDRLLKTAFEGVLAGRIKGNQGMHQLAVVVCALALDTQPLTNEWLDWVFSPEGGNIPGLMVANFDRDGTSDEGAPGYTWLWSTLVTEIAERLADYPAYTKHNIIRDFPQFTNTFLNAYRMAALGMAVPNIGDSGVTGRAGSRAGDPNFITKGYIFTKNPEFAKIAYHTNNNSADGLGRNIYSADPDKISREIKQIVGNTNTSRTEGGYLMSGFGLSLLEVGTGNSGIALATSYGRTTKHAHADLLNFDLLAFGRWLAPDHGYPEFATNIPSRTDWTGSTISHNTVFVNQTPQKKVWGGYSKMFEQLKGFGVVELDGKKAYPDINAYTRTMFLIGSNSDDKDNNAYVVDIFHVDGGNDHVYSFHGPSSTITSTGLKLNEQKKGTYAGEAIEKGIGANGFPVGYSFLYNVRKDVNPPSQFMLDWKVETGYWGLTEKDNVHLRMYSLNQGDDVALADGDPPQNKPGNPRKLGYVLVHRKGTNLNSTFVSVFEPYRDKPIIKSVQRIETDGPGIVLQVEHMNGNIDYVLYNPESQKVMNIKPGISMTGNVGYISKTGNTITKAVLVNGSSLKYANLDLKSNPITGKVMKMNKGFAGGGWILVDKPLPVDGSLNGQQIFISTNGERDASYTIRDVKREGNLTRINCGPITFVSTLKTASADAQDPRQYLYDFEEGASFNITSHVVWVAKKVSE